MTIAELGALGEFIGSIAVLVTLVFLVFQIRQTQKAIAANSYTTATEAIYDTFLTSATSEFLAGAFTKAQSGEALSSSERFAMMQYFRSLIRRWELVHYQTSQSFMPEERLHQFGQRMSNLQLAMFREAWALDEPTMTPEFKAWAEPYLAWNQTGT